MRDVLEILGFIALGILAAYMGYLVIVFLFFGLPL